MMTKRRICLLLTGLFCVVALVIALPLEARAASGTCGDNLTWTYEDTVLTITGQGPMESQDHLPWSDAYKTCTKVVVGEGVTTICNSAFQGYRSLTEVSLPSTLTKIGSYAFSSCIILKSVELPAGLQVLGWGAFSGCYELAGIKLPEKLTTVENYAFNDCKYLTEITVPDSVTTLGGSAFSGCYRLKKVTLGKNLTEMGGNVLQDCPALEEIVIPDKVPKIGGYAFANCTSLTSVTIGAGVETVEKTAFWGCPGITGFKLSSGNKHFFVDKGILYTKDKTELVLAPQGFSGSYAVLSGTKTIGAHSFYECQGLTSVTLPDSVTLIDEYAFIRCTSLTSAKLGTGVENIRTYAFAYTALPAITLPAAVRNVGDVAFCGCSSLKNVTFFGKMPIFHEYTFLYVTATCNYPTDGSWKNMGSYGGTLTWKALDCGGNHTVVTQTGRAATCTTEGLTEGSYCSYCGQVLQAQTTIPATHSYGEWETVQPATVATEGKAQRVCNRCGKTEEKNLPKLTEEEAQTEPTHPQPTQPAQPTEPSQPNVTQPAEPTQPQAQQKKNSGAPWIVGAVILVVAAAEGVVTLVNRKKKSKE